MKLHLVSLLCFVTSLVSSFHLPPHTLLQRHTVANLPHFVNVSHDCKSDISLVRWKEYHQTKPNIVLVPGLEFASLSLSQFKEDLYPEYNLFFVCSSTTNTPPLQDIVNSINNEVLKLQLKDILVIGESSGAFVALSLGLSNNTKGVVVINSATAYKNSPEEQTVDDSHLIRRWEYDLRRLLFLMKQRLSYIWTLSKERKMLMVFMFVNLLLLSHTTVAERVDKWVVQGNTQIKDKLHKYPLPVLIIAASKDEVFDSVGEAKRLKKIFPRSSVVYVPNCGHLCRPELLPLRYLIKKYL